MNATMSLENIKHYPVMLNQILSIISPQHGGTFIDCTFGGGGYSEAILKYPGTKVLAIDRDKSIKKRADILIKNFPERFNYYINKFSNLNKIITPNTKPKAIIFDLGLSSYQISDHQRGFSFKSTESLNMQMGMNQYSAVDVVNKLDKENLTKVIKILGDEKDGKLIANKIIKYRKKKRIETGKELSLIVNAAKKVYKKKKINPATKTFQAIRIFVNKELSELITGLIAATKILSNGGILIVISFHSLEDKIVKYFFSLYSNLKKNTSRYLPENDFGSDLFKVLLKKPLIPEKDEIFENPQSRSAKLRYAIRNNNSFSFPGEFNKKFENYSKLEGLLI